MPHYFFDIRFSHLVVEDATGHDFRDLGEAVRVAEVLLLDLNPSHHENVGSYPTIEISDDEKLLATVPNTSSDTTPH